MCCSHAELMGPPVCKACRLVCMVSSPLEVYCSGLLNSFCRSGSVTNEFHTEIVPFVENVTQKYVE